MSASGPDPDPEAVDTGRPIVRDRRRLDPETGELRDTNGGEGVTLGSTTGGATGGSATGGSASGDSTAAAGASASAAAEAYAASATAADAEASQAATESVADEAALELAAATVRVQELVTDLQRLQAEYVNYRRRVERDRDVARDQAVAGVLESMLPVLDDLHLAKQHGDLESGPFAAIAEKLETTLTRYGLERYGEPGEVFDPTIHEALIHTQAELAEGTTDTTVVQILQPGYRMKDRILRAARVAVADPE
jgi:molecular chaperone GrpE